MVIMAAIHSSLVSMPRSMVVVMVSIPGIMFVGIGAATAIADIATCTMSTAMIACMRAGSHVCHSSVDANLGTRTGEQHNDLGVASCDARCNR